MMRSRPLRRRGAWAALFALALQIVLAFGHMHPLVAGPGPFTAAVADLPAHPGAKNPGDAAQDVCAICVAIQLASTVGVPPPPSLPVPAQTFDVADFSGSVFVLPRLPPHPFQTRAPPAA